MCERRFRHARKPAPLIDLKTGDSALLFYGVRQFGQARQVIVRVHAQSRWSRSLWVINSCVLTTTIPTPLFAINR